MTNALYFLLNTLFNILTMLFLLRFLMQAMKVSFNNPIGQIILTLTDFAVKPVRRFIPSWKKLDLSTLLLAYLTQWLLHLAIFWLQGFQTMTSTPLLATISLNSLLGLLRTVFDIFFYAIILKVILSWVNPHSPISPVLTSITRPILAPIQKVVPAINGIDFSPFVAMILLQMLNILLFSS